MSAPSSSDVQAVLDQLEELERASTPLNRDTARSWRAAHSRVGSNRILETVELFVLAIEAGLLTVE